MVKGLNFYLTIKQGKIQFERDTHGADEDQDSESEGETPRNQNPLKISPEIRKKRMASSLDDQVLQSSYGGWGTSLRMAHSTNQGKKTAFSKKPLSVDCPPDRYLHLPFLTLEIPENPRYPMDHT